VALGDLAEIGRNMTAVEHAGRLLVVDCGVRFPGGAPTRGRRDPPDAGTVDPDSCSAERVCRYL
jgi:mRNA degradation ribonuclease J1/J2